MRLWLIKLFLDSCNHITYYEIPCQPLIRVFFFIKISIIKKLKLSDSNGEFANLIILV